MRTTWSSFGDLLDRSKKDLMLSLSKTVQGHLMVDRSEARNDQDLIPPHTTKILMYQRKRTMLAMDVAFVMEYLHAKKVIHFDIKCDNLLMNLKDLSRPICKLVKNERDDNGLRWHEGNTSMDGTRTAQHDQQ